MGTIANYFDEATDIHHIFPKAWCQLNGIPAGLYDSIVNKTPLSAHTNRVIGGRAPSDYLTRVANGAGITAEQLDGHVATHLVAPQRLRGDDFHGFFEARTKGVLAQVERAMGKAAVTDVGPPEPDEDAPTYAELEFEDDDA